MSEPTSTTPEGTTVETPAVTDQPKDKEAKIFDEAYVKSLRDEAAAARVAKRDAEDAARAEVKAEYEGKLAEESVRYTELQNEMLKQQIELEKVYASIDAKVPSDKVRAFVEILKGDDAESIAASAKAGLELFGGFDTKSPAYDPSQGRGGRKEIPLNGDPILNAIKSAVGIK